jgi:hypothetical protein
LSSVKSVQDAGSTGIKSLSSLPTVSSKFTIQTKTSSTSQWDSNILEKLRVLLTSSTKSLGDIFNEFD